MKKITKILAVILSTVLLFQVISVGITPAAKSVFDTPFVTKKDVSRGVPIEGPEGAPPMTAEQIAMAGTGEAFEEDYINRKATLIVGEVEELRSEDTKHYRHLDGTYTAAIHNGPVHFLNQAGKWQDIDNTLSLDKSKLSAAGRATYAPIASGWDLQVPESFEDGQMLTIGKDGYTVGMAVKAQANDIGLEQDVLEQPASDAEDTEEEAVAFVGPHTLEGGDAPALESETTAQATEEPTTAAEGTSVPENSSEAAALVVEPPAPETPAANTRRAVDLSVRAEINNDLGAERKAPDATATNDVEAFNEEIRTLRNLSSSATYRDIFPGTDLEYLILPNRIKESLIVKEIQAEYTYLFELFLDGLIPVPQEDGSICLYSGMEGEEPIFVLEAPYMFDAAGEMSSDVKMALAEDGTLTLTADAAWINAPERVLPVTIDPTITKPVTSGIQDAHVKTGAFGLDQGIAHTNHNYAGKDWGGTTNRTYIRFNLPVLPVGSIVADAQLILRESETQINSNSSKYLYAFECPSAWSMPTWGPLGAIQTGGIKWSNQPISSSVNGAFLSGAKQLDAFLIKEKKLQDEYYYINLTRSVRNWYEGGNNFGIMITTDDENIPGLCRFNSVDYASYPGVAVNIYYTTNTGLESHWSYETIDLGRSGTAYVNDYNGSLTYVHNDYAMSGNLLPINIAHVNTTNCDNASGTYLSMKLGVGFRLNIMEQLIKIAITDDFYKAPNNYRYKLTDGDGTIHYYSKRITAKYTGA